MFFGQSRQQLENICISAGVKPLHAGHLLRWAYKGSNQSWHDLAGCPKALKSLCLESLDLSDLPEIKTLHQSRYDHSVKFALQLKSDGSLVEAVLMPETGRLTLCLSSQVGCQQGCRFCHTARMGLKRQMTTNEIVGQVVIANRWLMDHPQWLAAAQLNNAAITQVTNIVFMGMGEPLDNVASVCDAINIFTESLGLNIPLRKIAVSTAGHLDGLKTLHQRLPTVPTALSLHATTETRRSQLMPINKRFPLGDILSYLRNHYQNLGGRHFLMVQFTIISGVNDDPETAQQLVDLLDGIPNKVNLIPLNEIDPSRFQSPSAKQLEAFRDCLHRNNIRSMIRYSKGQDIAAACGQLINQL